MKAVLLSLLLILPATAHAADSTANPQFTAARAALKTALERPKPVRRARNVILFIGDGMGINSVTAGRILAGQARGRDGASYRLSFETLPYSGLSKTYSADKLVTDSSNGISAIMTVVKTINAAIDTKRGRREVKLDIDFMSQSMERLSVWECGLLAEALARALQIPFEAGTP